QGRHTGTPGLAGRNGEGARARRSHRRQAAPRSDGDGSAGLRGLAHAFLQPGPRGLSARENRLMPVPAVATGYGCRLTVDLAAIRRNWTALDRVSSGALTGAVVKADAYGTGIAQSGRALYEAGARFFFAATPDEAVAVRAALPEDTHIFVLDGLFPGAAPLYVGERLMPILSSLAMLEEWLQACLARNEAFPAALHFDTGINRLGFRLNEASIVRRMIDQVGYAPQMVMSHLACADVPSHEKNRTQLALFSSIIA